MNITEARRVRHLIVRIDRGEELPSALLRALDQVEARAGFIEGIGSLEAAEIAIFDQSARSYEKARRIDEPCDVIALSGNIAVHDGAGLLRLSATLARETELGLQLLGGELVWARVYALELHVTVFDDVPLTRAYDERTGLALWTRFSSESSRPAASDSARPPPIAQPGGPTAGGPAAGGPTATASSSPSYGSALPAPTPGGTELAPGPALPARVVKPRDDVETYPEAGDLVSHFHFGECVIISSDGDRIRLRQERDGRVREVALTMLRIESPTTDPATGKRHFRLTRKH